MFWPLPVLNPEHAQYKYGRELLCITAIVKFLSEDFHIYNLEKLGVYQQNWSRWSNIGLHYVWGELAMMFKPQLPSVAPKKPPLSSFIK